MKIVALAGGVGGAKLADGLAQILQPDELTVIVNTGDDFDLFGVRICPDIDTVCYTLANLANPETGWGRAGETWSVFGGLQALGAPDWFHLGDRDLATHLERTRLLNAGATLSEVTRNFSRAWGVKNPVIPMTDQKVATIVQTREQGELAFQEYFVRLQCQPTITGFRFEGMDQAVTAPGVLEALHAADAVILCPSNPWVSIGPILALPGMQDVMFEKLTVAVSPIISGHAVKGPAAKMYQELGITPSAKAVAEQYRSILKLKGFALDHSDWSQKNEIEQWGIISLVTNILMTDRLDRRRLAEEILAFCEKLSEAND